MGLDGDCEPSPSDWVRGQVEWYEASDGTRGNTLADTGQYALLAATGGAPTNPAWYHLVADPNITIQDGPEVFDVVARVVSGEERVDWWRRAVDMFPRLAEIQKRTDREIPVFVAGAVAGHRG